MQPSSSATQVSRPTLLEQNEPGPLSQPVGGGWQVQLAVGPFSTHICRSPQGVTEVQTRQPSTSPQA